LKPYTIVTDPSVYVALDLESLPQVGKVCLKVTAPPELWVGIP
jgi:hypothetical protein